jgi:hypothetical protein
MKIFKDRKKKIEITSVEEWLKHCPPINPSIQWVDKRSAKEMAIFWTDIKNQNDFLMFLQNVSKDLNFNYALPEVATKFDEYKSPRKNDLCVFATGSSVEILISIEGKSDEHFGENYVDKEWILSINEKNKRRESKKLDRLIGLYQRFNCNADFLKLRYQLTYWLAGAIDEAIRNKINTVFLIVQEFHSDKTNEEKIAVNKSDLDFFVNFISDAAYKNLNNNQIIGPIKNQFTKQINLYIGKYQKSLE